MCLAVPMRIIEIDGTCGVVELDAITRRVRLDLLDKVSVGDYVLVHAGLAIAAVDEREAMETLALLREFTDEVQ